MEQNLVFLQTKLTLKVQFWHFLTVPHYSICKKNKKMFKNRTSFGSLGLSKKNQADITVDLKQQ